MKIRRSSELYFSFAGECNLKRLGGEPLTDPFCRDKTLGMYIGLKISLFLCAEFVCQSCKTVGWEGRGDGSTNSKNPQS